MYYEQYLLSFFTLPMPSTGPNHPATWFHPTPPSLEELDILFYSTKNKKSYFPNHNKGFLKVLFYHPDLQSTINIVVELLPTSSEFKLTHQ